MLKIFLTDLAAYNKGYLYGEWISLPCDNLQEELEKILKGGEALCFMQCGYYEKHEEWFVTDYEWSDVSLFSVEEYEDIFELNTKLESISSLDLSQLKVVKFLLDQGIVSSLDDAIEHTEDVNIYSATNLKSHAYDVLDELYNLDSIPSIITNNIDYDGVAYELSMDGRYFEVDDDLYEYMG